VTQSCVFVAWKDVEGLSSDVEWDQVRWTETRLSVDVWRLDSRRHIIQQVRL